MPSLRVISFVLGMVGGLLAATRAHAAPFAYVSNRDRAVLSVIDLASNAVVSEVPVGRGPEGVAVSAGGRASTCRTSWTARSPSSTPPHQTRAAAQ